MKMVLFVSLLGNDKKHATAGISQGLRLSYFWIYHVVA